MTVIHGEFYASNVLVQQTRQRAPRLPDGLGMAAVGPGLIDLAPSPRGWTGPTKALMAAACTRGLWRPAASQVQTNRSRRRLDCCRLHLAAVAGVGRQLVAAAEHSQDWLVEALRLAEQLAL